MLRVKSGCLSEMALDFPMVSDMAGSESGRGVDDVRALILADILRKNYLEQLLENDRKTKYRASEKKRHSKLRARPKMQERL